MNCLTEFTYSKYVDRELPAEETRQVEAHLTFCPRCRALVEALGTENRMLSSVLQFVEAEPVAAASDWRVGLKMLLGFLSMVGVAAACVTAATWLARLLPSVVEVNLFSRTTWMNLFFSGALYLADQGAEIMSSIVSALTTLIVGLLVVGGLYFLARRSASLALVATLALVFATAPAASAIEVRGGGRVNVPSGQTVDSTLIVGGDSVTIDGTINGDLITWAHRVVIRGVVKGDLIAGSQNLNLEGTVEGNVYTFAQALELHGTVGHTAYGWVQTAQIYSGAQVKNDLIAGCGVSNVSGGVGRDVALFCGNAELRGTVGRNVLAYVGNITLASPAHVGGDFTAHVEKSNQAQIEPGTTVSGKTNIELRKPRSSRFSQPHFYFWQAVQLVAALLTGVVLFALWPFLFAARPESAGRILIAAGIGFLVLIATPIAVVIAGITLVGLPLAVIGLLTFVVALYMAKIFVAALIGEALVGPPGLAPPKRLGSFALALLAGLAILFVTMNVPYVGGLVRVVVLLLGLGLAFGQLQNRWRRAQAG
jgi:hypothetical protein